MGGIYSDDTGGTARQPAPVLAAWIRELIGDVRNAQVPRLRELRARLQSGAFEWDNAALAAALSAVHSAGRELHARQLRCGWLARLVGRHKAAGVRFAAAYERIVACAARLKMEAAELAGAIKPHHSAATRLLVELDMECNALQAEVDQGVTWLQDMCVQLSRLANDEHPQLAPLAEAAQAFTHELKRLQSIAAMAREIATRGRSVLERRAALIEQVRGDVGAFDKSWMRDVGPVAQRAPAGRANSSAVACADETHDDLMRRLEAAADASTALQEEEHLMARHLGLLREELG